jgi:hypothetical protein
LAAAVNVFAARYEPEKSDLHPTDIRSVSLFEPTFLPASPDSFMFVPEAFNKSELLAMDCAYTDYEKLEKLTQRGIYKS